jgi:hypothetical protein
MIDRSTARRLALAVQHSDLDRAMQSLLLEAISAAVCYEALIAVMYDAAVTDGNSELLNQLWEVSTYDVRKDLEVTAKHDAT